MATATHARFATWRRTIEPWYAVFTLLTAVTSGIAMILLPLEAGQRGNDANAGLVMSTIGLGMITAPLWGRLADRLRWHRALCVVGCLFAAAGMLGFAFVESVLLWIPLAFLIGLGNAVVFTIGNLLIVEAHPQPEWNTRISWLQTFTTLGTVVGLALAGALTHQGLAIGFLLGAAIAGAAAMLAAALTRTPPLPHGGSVPPAHPVWSTEWLHSAVHHAAHIPIWQIRQKLRPYLGRPFSVFLAVWFFSMVGMAGVSGLYPLLMQNDFGVPVGPASWVLSAGTGLGLFLYAPAGLLATHTSAGAVLRGGLVVRVLCLAVLFVFGFGLGPTDVRQVIAIVAFTGVNLAWPLLSVSSTVLTSTMLEHDEGTGLGLYNASGALANLLGPTVAGVLATLLGYDFVWGFALVGVVAALVLTGTLGRILAVSAGGPAANAGAGGSPAST